MKVESITNNKANSVKPIVYKEIQNNILVKYAEKGDDFFFQVFVPPNSGWDDITNKKKYMKLIKVMDKFHKKAIYLPPKKYIPAVTIKAQGMALKPFADHQAKKAAIALASIRP